MLESGTALIMLSMATPSGESSQILHEPISDWYDVPILSYRDAYGGHAKIYYGYGHNCWDQVYSDDELWKWLLTHERR